MSLRAVEEDVAHILAASGLGSTTSSPPTIYAGPIPAGAPDACIACLESSSEPPEKYLGGARLAYHKPEVTVLVRGTAGDSGRHATAQRARAAWSALWDLHLPEYVRINPLDGGPTRLGPDANGRAQYSFTVRLEYVLATTSGLTLPLPARGPLHVPSLEVAGEAKVAGLLEVKGVAPGETAFRIPGGTHLALTATGNRYLYFDTATNYITSNSFFRAPLFLAGEGLGPDEAAFGVDAGAWYVLRNGRVHRKYADTTATAGDATANAFRGRAKVAAGQASVTLSNTLCLATSDTRAHVQQATADASGAFVVRTSTVDGALSIHLNTPPAADLVVAWEIID